MSGNNSEPAHTSPVRPGPAGAEQIRIEHPASGDGAAMWRVARDSQQLDLNSSYAYLLWCHDFTETSVVARVGGEVVGFVMGYRRPPAPEAVLVWQVAVDVSQRGSGVAGSMLDELYSGLVSTGTRFLETTITPDNAASIRLFSAFAERWGAPLRKSELFAATDFPDAHEAEEHYRIGPLAA